MYLGLKTRQLVPLTILQTPKHQNVQNHQRETLTHGRNPLFSWFGVAETYFHAVRMLENSFKTQFGQIWVNFEKLDPLEKSLVSVH